MLYADLIIKSNAIYTGKAAVPQRGCVVIKDGRILEVCNDEEAEAYYQEGKTEVNSYEDGMVMAGFIDAHAHFFMGAGFQSDNFVDLAETKSPQDCVDIIKAHLIKNPHIKHVLGWGWFLINWGTEITPTKEILDENFPDIPLYLFCIDGHTCWINTKAMEVCGITKETEVKFGDIQKDNNGELTGLLFEVAAEAKAFENGFASTEEDCEKMLKYAARSGITSITDLAASSVLEEEPRNYVRLLKAREEGKLTVRMHCYPSLGDDGDFTIAKQIRDKYQYPDFKCSGLKQFIDGTTSLYTSPLLEPYSDRPQEQGYTNYSPELYRDVITKANREGFSVRVHAIGDRAVRVSLDAYENSQNENDLSQIRNCVEHAENIHPQDIPRFQKLGVIASMQPPHLPLDANEKTIRIGKERARYEWPCRSLLDTGAVLAFGTDYPVSPLGPMEVIHGAVTRCFLDGTPVGSSPQEKITLKETLDAYTQGSAYSLGREDELGTLEKGKLADVVVLTKNLFDLKPQQYLDVEIQMTVMDGKVVYEK